MTINNSRNAETLITGASRSHKPEIPPDSIQFWNIRCSQAPDIGRGVGDQRDGDWRVWPIGLLHGVAEAIFTYPDIDR